MASAPKANLPLLYNDLMPLNTRDHAKWSTRSIDRAPWIAKEHAIPITSDEFGQAQRHFPIVFSNGDNPVPLALMGLHEGVNTFFDETGKGLDEDFYVPAYIRRYPYLLVRLNKDNEDMSLCFDPSSELLGEFKDGRRLFEDDGQPTDMTKEILKFCENFEAAGMRTASMVDELKKHDLLMDGEIAINRGDNDDKPFLYRGFKMVNQEKLREMRGDQLRTWNQNGLLPLIFAHLFSLDRMRFIFARQAQQGKGPMAAAASNQAGEKAEKKPAKKAEPAKS
jgi:hypothetical protein